MKLAVNTALLLISTHFAVNAVSFQRGSNDFSLPAYRVTKNENHVIRKLLAEAPNKYVCFFRSKLFAEYCFAFIEDQVVLIGPYKTHRLYRSQLTDELLPTMKEKDEYIEIVKGYPEIKTEDIRLNIYILFKGLYGTFDDVRDSMIDMQDYQPMEQWEEDQLEIREEEKKRIGEDLSYYYMAQIRAGNYEGAVRTYRRMMNKRNFPFILLNAVEGMSSIRAQTSLAMHEAGVSPVKAERILTEFKLRGRELTNMTDARKLCEKMIYESCRAVREGFTQHYSPSIQAAVDYIHRNLSEQISVPEIAAEAKLTPNSLTSKFHKEVGATPVTYINRQRMEIAANLLRNTQMSIQEICTRIGILDSNYFTRSFKKHFQCPPTEYRSQWHREEN